MIRLEVAVAAPLEQTLSYFYSSEEHPVSGDSLVGKRVLVHLGRRRVTGYVLGILSDEAVDYILKPVVEVLDREPLFHANLIPFFRWMARYYHYPIGEVIKTALPGGLTSGSEKKIILTDTGRENLGNWSDPSTPEPVWLQELLAKGYLTPSTSKKLLRDKKQKKILTKLLKDEYLKLSEQLRKDSIREKEEVCYSLSSGIEFPSDTIHYDEKVFNAFRHHLLEKVSGELKITEVKTIYYLGILRNTSGNTQVPRKDLLKKYPGATTAMQELVTKKFVFRTVTRVFRNPFGSQLAHCPCPEKLTAEQEKAVEKISSALSSEKFQTFLLHGVTGSGKTEVYLKAAEKALANGKDVLVLVPEIALAIQLESHFVSRFGDQVVLLHSGLSTGERFDQWSLAASGKAKIVIGARSAIFSPLRNPGLIVVDEEHDAGYKQDDSLRYQGRDLAVLRGRIHNAVVVLGSATPSVTSYYHAMKGKYTLLKMAKRVEGRPMPVVTVIDLRKRSVSGGKEVFRSELREALAENLSRKEQSLLLMNRRGFSATVFCKECGTPVECIHCHVSLVFHKKQKRLVCHYCGYNMTQRLVCAKCRSETLVPMGFGTERIEEEVRSLFPDARVARLDSDTAVDRKFFLQVLKAMYNRDIDILIGTQMIAKGHHFPYVTLVGVAWADGGLNMPDFRAAERTFQLLSQVTGRAGRGENPGRVIIQTMQPDHYSIVFARNHQFEELYERELKIRKMPFYPPFVRLIVFLIHGESESEVRKAAANVAICCREIIAGLCLSAGGLSQTGLEVLGPAPAPIDRLCDRYRWQVMIKGRQVEELHKVCSGVVNMTKSLTAGDTRISVDVDPENMM
jgi:primosomal protein N' (replication factor Y) (superfamily II helicase)